MNITNENNNKDSFTSHKIYVLTSYRAIRFSLIEFTMKEGPSNWHFGGANGCFGDTVKWILTSFSVNGIPVKK